MSTHIESLWVRPYEVPTERGAESDGTLRWDSTTIVVVEVTAGELTGIGYTYNHRAAATLIETKLADLVCGRDVMQIGRSWRAMVDAVRNLGRRGVAASAISAVDVALWDLKAKVLGVPVVSLLGGYRPRAPVYGSGGFCSLSRRELQSQLAGWIDQGIEAVKMKVGRDPATDPRRVQWAREAIGTDAQLFVDANGAYAPKQAIRMGQLFSDQGVCWFEEPVSSDNLAGLRRVRDRAPPVMEIAAGEYGWDPWYFEEMLAAGAVDVVQADATRCLGLTGFLSVANLAYGHQVEVSAHTAPTVHAPALCGVPNGRHVEYFADHVRIEKLCFDGTLSAVDGALEPDLGRPGLGIELERDAIESNAI